MKYAGQFAKAMLSFLATAAAALYAMGDQPTWLRVLLGAGAALLAMWAVEELRERDFLIRRDQIVDQLIASNSEEGAELRARLLKENGDGDD